MPCTIIALEAAMPGLRQLLRLRFAIAFIVAFAATAGAQMPGQPVLQNAFTNPGWSFGVNYGDSDEALGYGAAVGWGNAGAKFGVSLGGGVLDPPEGENVFAWGARGMWSALRFADTRLGVAVFGGIGGARQGELDLIEAPIGVSGGFRAAIGDDRGVSVYAAPFLRLSRADLGGGEGETNTLFRASVGLDAALLPRLGVTLGYEFGATADAGEPGPAGGIFGLGFSYVLR
jgi:hypothetical protein